MGILASTYCVSIPGERSTSYGKSKGLEKTIQLTGRQVSGYGSCIDTSIVLISMI
jgi:hypothetical protein